MKYLTNKFIFVPFRLSFDWPCDFISQTCNLLAKENYILAFLWADAKSIKEIITDKKRFSWWANEGNLIKFTPVHLIPFRRFKFVEKVNLRLNLLVVEAMMFFMRIRTQHRILWLFEPEFSDWLGLFPRYKTIFDCVDYFSSPNPEINARIQEKQTELIKNVDHMVVNSHILKRNHCHLKSDIPVVPQGFRLESYQKTASPLPRVKRKKVRVGYIGGINYRIDLDLLLEVVKRRPAYEFVISGIIQRDKKEEKANFLKLLEELKSQPNVKFVSVKKENLPKLVSTFSAGIIPYTDSAFNTSCFPMKALEYFYCGVPVVSTYIEELARYYSRFVKISSNAERFASAIDDAIRKWPMAIQLQQREVAISHSWKNKLEAIDRYLFGKARL